MAANEVIFADDGLTTVGTMPVMHSGRDQPGLYAGIIATPWKQTLAKMMRE